MKFTEIFWGNPEKLYIRCEKPRSYFIPYDNEDNAKKGLRCDSRYFKSLNGTWASLSAQIWFTADDARRE